MRLAPAQGAAEDSCAVSSDEKEQRVIYRLMGWFHMRTVVLWGGERGQGTVEYVALILLVAALLAGVVAATKGTKFGTGGIAETIVDQIKSALKNLK
jgi:hypothetical protein